jgi:hypothetical protein
MRTFIADIIPQIQRFSQRLDNLTLLTNQHWVSIDNIANSKTVFIFRNNNQLLISKDGLVEKATWEYLGNNSLLIDKSDTTHLFKHGFFDQNILALKVDSKNEYAIFINENKYDGDINSVEKVIDFLHQKYVVNNGNTTNAPTKFQRKKYPTDKGSIEIEQRNANEFPKYGDKVYINNMPAPDAKYKLGRMWFIKVKKGEITDLTLF